MIFGDLRQFIREVEKANELKVIEGADWDLEIGAITEWQSQPDAPLLIFDKIKDYKPGYRLLCNLTASRKRLGMLFNLPGINTPMEFVQAWRERLKHEFKPVPPVEVKTGPVKENILTGDAVDLFKFPTPRWHELDGGRYIGTGHMVITRDPDEGWINLGTYRVQIHDRNTAGIFMVPGQHGDMIRRKYWSKGLSCPVAISCGQDPQLWYVSTMRLPWKTSEYEYAGWIRGKPVEVTMGETVDLPIPATAEIVLEGELLPLEVETRVEGPFGEWTGYYGGAASPEAVIRIKAILHRNEPILCGVPPFRRMPMYFWGRDVIRSAQLWSAVDKETPGVTGVWVLEEGAGAEIVVISIKQLYAGHAKRIATAAKFVGATAGASRFIITVDDDIDPTNISDVLWALGTRCDPENSIDIIRGVWANRLDTQLSPEKRARGDFTLSSAIINACKPYHWKDEFPKAIQTDQEFMERVREKWRGVLE